MIPQTVQKIPVVNDGFTRPSAPHNRKYFSFYNRPLCSRMLFALYIAYFHSRPDAVVDPWLKEVWQKVLKIYPLPPGKEVISANIRSVEHHTEFFLGNRVS